MIREEIYGLSRVSILVLMEVLREGVWGGCIGGRADAVSILVLMEVLREVREAAFMSAFAGVSILVLMEVLREEGVTGHLHRSLKVSILVLMEVLREVGRDVRRFARGHDVSILVLMEVLREARVEGWASDEQAGFNPCFNGSVERGLSVASDPM